MKRRSFLLPSVLSWAVAVGVLADPGIIKVLIHGLGG